MPKKKKIIKIMLITFLILGSSILLFIALIWINSPGNPRPITDSSGIPIPGSLSEKVFLTIGGERQGMFIKSKNLNNPVLLYLHGGMPDYFLTAKYPTHLEDIFTVVWWEQRGSGISYHKNISKESLTLSQMISDTKEVTHYLLNRFGKEKIYLMGHSGGTFIGIQVAAEAPELYYAYMGVAQMSYQLASEKRAYDYMLTQFKEQQNSSMVSKLEKAPVDLKSGVPSQYLKIRDQAMHSLGVGTMHQMKSVVTGLFFPSLFFKEYTLSEKYNLWAGKSKSGVSVLWNTILATDLSKQVTDFKIPVYFFHGIYDYTCSYSLSESYFNKINAPVKGFYRFNHSAHSPIFEEPEKVISIIKSDVIKGQNNQADIK
jgi:pimeloyl-ACP methyl ester carboxylesterase